MTNVLQDATDFDYWDKNSKHITFVLKNLQNLYHTNKIVTCSGKFTKWIAE